MRTPVTFDDLEPGDDIIVTVKYAHYPGVTEEIFGRFIGFRHTRRWYMALSDPTHVRIYIRTSRVVSVERRRTKGEMTT